MKTILFFLIFGSIAFGFSGAAWAQTPTKREIATAYRTVQNASYFAIGGTGYAGTLSGSERALQVLIAANDKRNFEALLHEKNDVAKLYGLAALRYFNTPQYRQYVTMFRSSKATVSTMRGCMQDREPIVKVVEQIDEKGFDILLSEDIKRAKDGKP